MTRLLLPDGTMAISQLKLTPSVVEICQDPSMTIATRPDWKEQVRATQGVEVTVEAGNRLRVRAGPMAMLRLRGKLSPRFRITAT